jgi:hypothetical protein
MVGGKVHTVDTFCKLACEADPHDHLSLACSMPAHRKWFRWYGRPPTAGLPVTIQLRRTHSRDHCSAVKSGSGIGGRGAAADLWDSRTVANRRSARAAASAARQLASLSATAHEPFQLHYRQQPVGRVLEREQFGVRVGHAMLRPDDCVIRASMPNTSIPSTFATNAVLSGDRPRPTQRTVNPPCHPSTRPTDERHARYLFPASSRARPRP